jgi:O-antigen/teichoic acid export membrane protein
MSRTTFFRQSGWMMFATLLSGVFMFGVHPFSKKIPESEYGVLGTLLAALNCLGIPALGLQMVFAQQTAAALTDEQKRALAGTARRVLFGTFVLWAVTAALVFTFHQPILERWKIVNPWALWLILLVGLGAVWQPVFGGILQGHQNFLWFGWASILNGAGRFTAVAVIVLLLHGHAAGMCAGILIGTLLSLAIYAWHGRHTWLGPRAPFGWRPWLGRVVPLTLGFGACQFMFSADPLFVQAYFSEDETFAYMAAGTLARALVAYTGPIAAVMFPKIVRSVALAERTDLMQLTLLTTAGLAILGAIGLKIVAPWVLPLVFKESFVAALPLLPRFAWSMVPLTLAIVLVNNLMARERFQAVPWLVLVAVLYGLTLSWSHDSFLIVIRNIGLFNLLFLGVAALFTWVGARKTATT